MQALRHAYLVAFRTRVVQGNPVPNGGLTTGEFVACETINNCVRVTAAFFDTDETETDCFLPRFRDKNKDPAAWKRLIDKSREKVRNRVPVWVGFIERHFVS
jgi:hypothetical protein